MFSEFRFEDFKSYKEATLKLAPLTLLIGANASGKSNAIEGLRFLSWLSEGRRLDDVLGAVQEEDISIRGTLKTLGRHGIDTFQLGCSLANVGEWRHFSIRVKAGDRDLHVLDESVRSDDSTVPLYQIVSDPSKFSNEVQVAYNNFARGGKKPQIPCSNRRAIFTQLDTPSRFKQEESQKRIPEVAEALRASFREMLFLDPNPQKMRSYSFTSKELRDDGGNLSGVLHHLCEEQDEKNNVLGFIRDLPEQDIRGIEFIGARADEVMVQLVESFGEGTQTWDAPMLSDGTLRVLAVAAAVLSAPRGSLIAIEEIDNGVHPSRAEQLLTRIKEVADRRNLRVLLTSHNPALLDALPTTAIPNVVCCFRDPVEGDSKLVRLDNLPNYPELTARGPLGRLMTKGVLDHFLKDALSESEKKKKDLKWLDSFRAEVTQS